MTSESDSLPAAGSTASAAPATTTPADSRGEGDWRLATKLVQGGILRSPFGETCEAIYMTSGYVYGSAEEAEAAFANKKQRFIYSRFSNPTVQMFEDRMALLEGAEAARATATGMAAVFASLACQLRAGDRVVASDALFGSCQYVLAEILPRFGVETVLSTAAISRNGAMPSRARLRRSSSRRRPTRACASSICRRWRSLRMPRAPSSSSTMSSPPRCSSARWRWARTSSSIPRPSISTARAAP